MSLRQLTDSFLDLWHHFDPIEARESDREGPPPKLPQFDPAGVAQHTAAFRSLLGAAEELDIETIDEEIDRTLLIDSIRLRLHRLGSRRGEQANPALWVDRLRRALAIGANDPAFLASVPEWVDRFRETVSEPSRNHLQLALEDLTSVRQTLAAERSDAGEADLVQRVDWALANLDSFLRNDLIPMPGDPPGLGESEIDWHLNFSYKLNINARDAARRLDARMTALANEATTLGAVETLPEQPSPVAAEWPKTSDARRRLTPVEWPIAWEHFLQARRSGESPERRLRWLRTAAVGAAVARTELRIHTGEVGLTEGLATVRRLTGSAATERDLLLAPLRQLGETMLAIQWEILADRPRIEPRAMIDAVRSTGLLHPELIAWKIAADG